MVKIVNKKVNNRGKSKMSKSINVVLFNGMTGEIEEHKIHNVNGDGMYDEVTELMFDDYMEKYPLEEFGKSISLTPQHYVDELTERDGSNCVFPLKEGYGNIVMYNDDCSRIRSNEWNGYLIVGKGDFLFGSLLLMNIKGSDKNGEPIYGDLFLDKEYMEGCYW